MYIYNRWGVLVFESQDISRGWDGTYKNDPAPSGAYVYRIEYAVGTATVETTTLTGTVVLVR
jgi:gliding motility-associated-like protein